MRDDGPASQSCAQKRLKAALGPTAAKPRLSRQPKYGVECLPPSAGSIHGWWPSVFGVTFATAAHWAAASFDGLLATRGLRFDTLSGPNRVVGSHLLEACAAGSSFAPAVGGDCGVAGSRRWLAVVQCRHLDSNGEGE